MDLELTPQVWGITGNLGGGKTLTSVYLGVNAMRRGYFVVSNVTFNIDKIAQDYGDFVRSLYMHISLDDPECDPYKFPTGSPRGSGGGKRVLVILDECAEWFDQYSNLNDVRISRLNSWMRHSSKRSQDVLLVVQRKEYLNKSIRSLISKWVIVDDMSFWRMPVLRARVPFMKGFVMQRHFDRLKNLLAKPSFISKSRWGRYYNTAECLNIDGASTCYEYQVPPTPYPSFLPLYIIYFISIIVLYLQL